MHKTLLAAVIALTVSAGSLAAAPAAYKEPLDAQTLDTIKSEFGKLIELANRHDFKALHGMFWQSPSALLVAKSAIASEGNWAGFWGNEAIDQKLHDIGTSGPVVLEPDYSQLKVVGLTPDVAESFVPMNITVSYAGQSGTPKPFLMIINWIRVAKCWKVASEIILPVPPAPAAGGYVPSDKRREGERRFFSTGHPRPEEDVRKLSPMIRNHATHSGGTDACARRICLQGRRQPRSAARVCCVNYMFCKRTNPDEECICLSTTM